MMKTVGGQRLTLLRSTLGFSQQDLANQTEVHSVTVSRIENANEKELPQYERSLRKIAKKLESNPDFLITGKGSMWLTGTDEENVARIKAGGKQGSEQNPYREALIQELTRRAEAAEADKTRLQNWLDRLINGGANFRKALNSTSYSKLKVANG